ncbi:MAG: DEAD/DEAH box helicase [Anaerolineaceae bacterium]|nr:DEAD/DEAH box helicase [Anaerolineaceae bacterium]
MKFSIFNFNPQINAGINAAGYQSPTPIQEEAIPAILVGKDVLGLAQTGTGKTAAFALPILQKLMKGKRGRVRALVLSPTRELAEQTHSAFKELGNKTGLRMLSIYGGVSVKNQINRLRQGVDIVIACPGRLLDLKNQGEIDLNNVEILVLDEADHMVDMGFLPDIKRIISALPKNRQTLLFSATMPDKIYDLATSMMDHPVKVAIDYEKPVDKIDHAIYPVVYNKKLEMLIHLLHKQSSDQVLVFTRTKRRATKLAEQLQKAGFSTASLQGNLSQNKRDKAMRAFRQGRVKVLVATDIAARGIDVMDVSHVINYDIPDTAEAYTHRTGRTGRMEQDGTAFSLVTQEDVGMVRSIEKLMGKKLERRNVDGYTVRLNDPKQNAPQKKKGRMSRSNHNNPYRSKAKLRS